MKASSVDVDQFLELKPDDVLTDPKGKPRKRVKPAVAARAEKSVIASDMAVVDAEAATRRYDEITKSLEQDRKERRKYANKLFALLSYWLLFFGAVITLRGISQGLSDQVMITVVAATTLKVIGLFWLVTRYLFPPKENGK